MTNKSLPDPLTPEERIAAAALPWPLPPIPEPGPKRPHVFKVYTPQELAAANAEMAGTTAAYVRDETQRQEVQADGDPGGAVRLWEALAGELWDEPTDAILEDGQAIKRWLDGLYGEGRW